MLQVRLRGLALDQSNSPVVILEVEKTNKGFGIWIGPFEAEALALAVSGKDFPRPLTYDLFINTVERLGASFDDNRCKAFRLPCSSSKKELRNFC